MKYSELKGLETKELVQKLASERANYNQLKLKHAISPVEDTSLFKKSRRQIAQILTELRQRELNK